jgi:FkbM family methyltransferase
MKKRMYRFLGFCARSISEVGVGPGAKWFFATAQLNLKISRPSQISIRPRFLDYPVKLRARTSDPFVFRQIMIENEYEPLRRLQLANIIDLGANIGLASVYFLSRFPNSRIFAVEADEGNFNACRSNLAPYKERAHVLHGAAWSRKSTLTLQRRTCEADNLVRENSESESRGPVVEGWDIGSLIALSGFGQIDLLKIDIEGAEKCIFSEGADGWLPSVKNLCIELHGDACRQAFFAALAGYDYEHSRSGELDVCLNLRRKTRGALMDKVSYSN